MTGKRIIKRLDKSIYNNEWYCSKCGLKFVLSRSSGEYLGPNYCPNCGSPAYKGFARLIRPEKEEMV